MRTFTREELKKAAGELAFEMQHFRCYGTLKDDAKLGAFSAAASQAVGYSLLIHLRVLMDFFFAEPTKDDCHIEHFKALPDFAAAFPDSLHVRTPRTEEVVFMLNKRMAHMTATRWETPPKSWGYYDEYAPTILDLITKFEKALPGELAESYTRAYHRWETGHKGIV